jgi:phage terminase large subunit
MDPRVVQYLPAFAWHLCGLRPYPAQEAVLADLSQPYAEVAACCANGVGKTTMLAAPTTLWHAMTFKNSVTITTSGVFRQVKEQMWPQIHNLARQFKGLVDIELNNTDFRIPATNSRVVGFSTDDPGKFEGWHADSLLIILDEAKTIPDPIFEAVERCKQGQPVRVLMLSSPGGTQGQFYEAIKGRQKHMWKRHIIRADQCPHIRPEFIKRTIEKYGEQHPLVRSMIFAEFMDIGENTLVFPRAVVDRVIANPPQVNGKERAAFCDFAAGGDENVFALREGNTLIDVVAWVERNTMAAVGRFLQLFRKHGLEPGQVYGDGSGLGIPMCDAIEAAGFNMERVNNGTPAYDDHLYANRGAEMWFSVAVQVEKLDVNLGAWAQDERLTDQLCTRKSKVDMRGRLALESKDEMKRRGLPSPDRADAVIGAFANAGQNVAYRGFCGGQSLSELLEAQVQQDQMAGFDAGY